MTRASIVTIMSTVWGRGTWQILYIDGKYVTDDETIRAEEILEHLGVHPDKIEVGYKHLRGYLNKHDGTFPLTIEEVKELIGQ